MPRHDRPIHLSLLLLSVGALACAPDRDPLAPVAPAATVTQVMDPLTALRAGGRYVPGEVIVKFRRGTGVATRERALAAAQVRAAVRLAASEPAMPAGAAELLTTDLSVSSALAVLAADPAVEYAEPNWIYQAGATANDPFIRDGSSWNLGGPTSRPKSTFGINATAAWAANRTDCSRVYVGIIDEGVYFGHEDLAANAGRNPGEIAGNGVDDDQNGFVDDVNGWDFVNGDNTVFDGVEDDHGTHVAGTIGAVGGNGIGVAGVCWRVQLLSAKFIGPQGGTAANAVRAIDYFTDLKKKRGIRLVATNNSWGGGPTSKAITDAIARANTAGILFIAAAGNEGRDCDASDCSPGNTALANVITVASIGSTGQLSAFSNRGARKVHLGAPGESILSTVPVSAGGGVTSGYGIASGTSMAAPHVTGAAALYAATRPSATAAQIRSAIIGGVTATPALKGKVSTGGRLNVGKF